ncbi:MAG: restriction endonuclease, partial [Candidatus Nomurabacteria bacterium]|nr:restriction endonuclease [Candidatus Nomurabacteria bacterium]
EQGNLSPNKSFAKDAEPEEESWQEYLMNILQTLSPGAFESLAQRILRESGVDQVEVTGRSGDGGIDGSGVLKIAGFISFRVQFQCKRWQKPIPVKEVRDFGGSLRGRDAKGIFITTSTFTKDAVKEASREGAEIDLIDGVALVKKIKSLGLGLKITNVEKVEIDQAWFEEL